MTTRKFIISTPRPALSLAAIPPSPAASNPAVRLGQRRRRWQTGIGDQIGVFQNGILNTGIATQYGNHNMAAIGQDGFNNYADT